MKRLLLALTVILIFMVVSKAQNVQLDNAGFEEWEDVGVGEDEPVKWSSIKTSDNSQINPLAPVIWERSEDAHSGSYSLKLKNVNTIIGAVATGGMTNGRFHTTFNPEEGFVYSDLSSDQWNKPFTGRPDSIAVWIKYFPVGNDTLQAKFLLHKDSCTIGIQPALQDNVVALAKIELTGEYSEWTRVSAPFVYSSDDNPEYFLAMLTSGAGLNAVAGSEAYYDDVEIIYEGNSVFENQALPLNIYYSGGILFFTDMPDGFKGSTLNIINLAGEVVFSREIVSGRIPVSLHNGLYIAEVETQKALYTKKLFIHR